MKSEVCIECRADADLDLSPISCDLNLDEAKRGEEMSRV